MTEIIIVDYSLENAIAIILNRFMPMFEAVCHKKYVFKKG